MLILSQDGRIIVNLDNIKTIELDIIADFKAITIFRETNEVETGVCGLYIGKYDTEERAKEVLQEIINEYKSQNYLVYDAETGSIKDVNKNIVFIMPKE